MHTNPQSAFRGIVTQFENVMIYIGGAGNYVPKADSKIRRIKEMYQSIKAGLAWKLPVMIIKKALYGCVQASKLWYKKICRFLEREGYKCREMDPCVFRKNVGEYVYTLLVYMDDILVSTKPDKLKQIKQVIIKEFKWITVDVGEDHSYLGKQLQITKGRDEVDMRFYIEKVLVLSGVLKKCLVPGDKEVFMVREDALILSTMRQKSFHMTVSR